MKHMPARETNQEVAPTESDWGSRDHVHALVLIMATAVGIYLCYRLVQPLLPALVWALTLAVLFTPFHRWLETKLNHPYLAASISVLVAGLIVAVPAIFVGQRLIMEAAKGAELIKEKVESGEWRRSFEAQPRLAPLADWLQRRVDPPGTTKQLAAWLTETAGAVVKGSVVQVIGFFVTLYLMFYFQRDRLVALQSLRSVSPLSEAEMGRLFRRVADTIHATVFGTVTVAAVQGLLGGLMFWWLGLPIPLLWGVMMAFLAVVPVLGAFIIWIPAAIFLALGGHWGQALILAAWGGIVIAGIDNVLYPILVGDRLKMHTVLAFISLVGGVMLFGSSGIILGPVILTVTLFLLEMWRHRADSAAEEAKPA